MRTGAHSVPSGRLENTKCKMSHQNTGEKPDRPIESETIADGSDVRMEHWDRNVRKPFKKAKCKWTEKFYLTFSLFPIVHIPIKGLNSLLLYSTVILLNCSWLWSLPVLCTIISKFYELSVTNWPGQPLLSFLTNSLLKDRSQQHDWCRKINN